MKKSEPIQTRISVRLTPKASSNAITDYAGGIVSMRITAPPIEGAANAACCEFLAEALGVRKSQVSLVSGAKSRSKVLLVTELPADEAERRLTQLSEKRRSAERSSAE
ncbi:MAG: DUF167 domain-containing protein [Capsulimonas sp.]|uniref:DUF167 domain-containing protein n=1 Tax=Capsulimonas sp. TaxID=2494211 RepID=UPI003264666C